MLSETEIAKSGRSATGRYATNIGGIVKKTQKLTVAAVKFHALEFYKRKKLAAQHPDQSKRYCAYELEGGYRCAIGAAMSDIVLKSIGVMQGCPLQGLRNRGIIDFSEKELSALQRLQDRHDTWCNLSRQDGGGEPVNIAEANFLAEVRS